MRSDNTNAKKTLYSFLYGRRLTNTADKATLLSAIAASKIYTQSRSGGHDIIKAYEHLEKEVSKMVIPEN